MTPEFSRLVAVDRVPAEGLTEELHATEEERQALARRFGLVSIAELSSFLQLSPWRRGGIKVTGRFDAVVEQICVVTLDPFKARIAEEITRYFAGQNAPGHAPAVHNVESLGEDEPDVISGSAIDLGELVAESLGLALDPYPRKPGVEFVSSDAGAEGMGEKPFDALRSLKQDLKSKEK
jgi:uncharacterized metal-binding protein YceD (DUF177 family)